jgi:hypothetical protein
LTQSNCFQFLAAIAALISVYAFVFDEPPRRSYEYHDCVLVDDWRGPSDRGWFDRARSSCENGALINLVFGSAISSEIT